MTKTIIYQMLPRIFGNRSTTQKQWGTIAENGCGHFSDIDEHVLRQLKDLGATAVWYTGVIRHASQTDYSAFGIPRQNAEVVKGKAGSPYAISDYYDVDPDLANNVNKRMQEFEALVSRTHRCGLSVIMDFVPNHVAREYHSICRPEGVKDIGEADDPNMNFSPRNNFYYCWGQPLDLRNVIGDKPQNYHEQPAKATGNDQFSALPSKNDWYETVKLNYGVNYCDAGGRSEHFFPVPDTWHKMSDILLFWASKGVDGFRCDMAEMVPPQFWAYSIAAVKAKHPHILFIGEVYNPQLYDAYIRVGFDFLYDKVGMYDCLRDVVCGHRHASEISWQWQKTDRIAPHMLYFLENHDEQRIASDFFCADGRKAIPALLVAALLRGNPLMIYSGQEFGERGMDSEGFSGVDGRTTIFDYWSLQCLQRGYFGMGKLTDEQAELRDAYRRIMHIASAEKAFTDGEMFDLMYVNPQLAERQFAFMRRAGSDLALVVANFSDEEVCTEVVIPRHAFDYLKIKEGRYAITELLAGTKQSLDLRAGTPLKITVPARGGIVYKVKI